MLAGQLALIVAALFTGAAIYVNVAEQPARLQLDDRSLLAEWKQAYKRGSRMQAPLALIGFALGLASAFLRSDWRWLIGAFILVANWPYTLIVILPVNNRLLAAPPQDAGPTSRELIQRWGRLHAVRSALGASATALFLWASLTQARFPPARDRKASPPPAALCRFSLQRACLRRAARAGDGRCAIPCCAATKLPGNPKKCKAWNRLRMPAARP